MAGTVADIIQINIDRERSVPASLGFGWANFVATGPAWTGPIIRQYADLDEVIADDDVPATGLAFANLYFSQEVRPTRLYITVRDTTAEPDQTYVAAITAARLVNDDWYAVATDSSTKADVVAVSAAIEALYKIYLYKTAEAGAYDGASTTDTLYAIKASNYDRSLGYYHHQAASVQVEGGPLGLLLPKQPGSVQWAYKTFTGYPVSALTSAQRNAIFAKNGNVYTERANVSVFEKGKVASGEWIDVIMGIDWLRFAMENAVFTQFVNNDKIEYEDSGVQVIVNAVKKVLDEAVTRKILAKSPAPQVTYPSVASISATDKGNRFLPDIRFSGTLSGAIISTRIDGKISL